MSSNPNTALAEAQFASLSDKTASGFRQQGTTSLDDESGVTDGGLGEFQKFGAGVEVGRTGASGGGDNMVRRALCPEPGSRGRRTRPLEPASSRRRAHAGRSFSAEHPARAGRQRAHRGLARVAL